MPSPTQALPTIILVDGSSFVFRAFHAMPELSSPDGRPTGATYGMINMLKQLRKRHASKYFACVFDAGGKTFRNEIYPQYKANRSATPPSLIPQTTDIHAILRALGIPVIMKANYEADDIIGTITALATSLGYKVIIVTGDKDFIQLLNEKEQVMLLNTMGNEELTYEGAQNKFGINPTQFVDYLALIGDKVDNVPGITKCGPKTAAKWLGLYGTLDNIIANRHSIGGVVGDNLRSDYEWLNTAKNLLTIDCDMPIADILPNKIADLIIQEPNIQQLQHHYQQLGFHHWLKELTITNNNSANFTTSITTIAALQQLLSVITANTELPIGILVLPNSLLNISYLRCLAVNYANESYVITIDSITHDHQSHLVAGKDQFTSLFSEAMRVDQNNIDNYNKLLQQLFTTPNPKVFAHYKSSLSVLSALNFTLNNVIGDLTLAHYIHNSGSKSDLSNIFANDTLLAALPAKMIDAIGLGMQSSLQLEQLLADSSSREELLNTLGAIASRLLNKEQQLIGNFSKEELHLYRFIELPLVPLLVAMEHEGILLNTHKIHELSTEIHHRIYQLEQQIYQLSHEVFNINSTKQLQEVLFTKMSLPTAGIKKNTHGYSTDETSLSLLASQGIMIAKYLLEYRNLSKLLNTYVSKLPRLCDAHKRIHTTYEQAIVISGRLSSREPNLQNIPQVGDMAHKLRRCFIAKPNHVFVAADYSQIELRVLAHFSQDELLIAAFNHGLDIHAITASELFNKPVEAITHDERHYAKTINFSIIYGKTAFGLANELKIDRSLAANYIKAYFAKYPKVQSCLEQFKQMAHDRHYVSTLLGRRIYLPQINAGNKMMRESMERLAINAPMQGSCADIIKIAMLNIDSWLKQQRLASKMLLQIHDELILEVPDHEVNLIIKTLPSLMSKERMPHLAVQLQVSIKSGATWQDAQK